MHVTPQNGISLISDRHEAIKSAYRRNGSGWSPEHTTHLFCIRHIAQNFMRAFKNAELRKIVTNMGYAVNEPQFRHYHGLLQAKCPEAVNWVDCLDKQTWTQAYDGGRRYGHMTTNLAESINALFKGERNLPITALVKGIYFKLATLFAKRGEAFAAMISSGRMYTQTLTTAMDKNKSLANSHIVHRFSRENHEFYVEEICNPLLGRPTGKFKVNLYTKRCDCGVYQALHFPCSHAIAACSHVHLDCMTLVDPVYTVQFAFNAYKEEFAVVGNEGYWPTYTGYELWHNPQLRRDLHGRPKSTRIRTEMDLREKGHPKRCGLCKTIGHTRKTCPNRGTTSN